MDFYFAKKYLRALAPVRRQGIIQLAVGAAAMLAFASLHAQTVPVEQFGLTAVNSNGNALYNVTVTPNTPPSNGALITGTAVLNTDGAAHGSFFAVARVPNSVTSAMDLIVADAENGRILRYPGPGPTSYAVSTPIFTWSHQGSGPKYPLSLSSDVAGDVFVVSAGVPFDTQPALWVLPFNATTGAYGAPILIDNTCGIVTEVVVATTAATPIGSAAPAWNVGDVLVLSNDLFNARVMVYSQSAIQSVLASGKPLNNPTSVAVGPSLLRGTLPIGMDIWPADSTHGVSLLLTTLGGRIMRFDSASGAMTADFASGLGFGLQRIKVGTYSTLTYAFVSQFTPGRGQILQFGAPPAGSANPPLASLSTGNKDPQGLATSSSGSVPVTACIAPSVCGPLGPQLTTQLSSTGSVPTTAPLLEESCVVQSDPRVTVAGTSWSCAGGNLDVAKYCPGFPSTVLPGTMCGHSGPTGAGFVVVKSTAKTVDQNANNTFFQQTVDPNLPLPGPLNLTCPQLEVFAWAPRSDLPLIEGTIVEGGPAPGSNYFIDLSGFCDNGGGNSHVLSMMAYGLGLNSNTTTGMTAGLPGFVTDKFTNLTSTISAANAQITGGVAATVQGYVNQAQTFFNAGLSESASNGYSCAMNSLASGDAYVRSNLSAFSGLSPPGNPNPAGEIDGRLANLFLPIDLFFLLQPANAQWPTTNVPPCVTLTPSPATVIITAASPGVATLTWGPATAAYPLSFPPTQCTISATDGAYKITPGSLAGSGSVSTGPLTALGTYSAQLMCSAAAGNSIQSFTQATVNVIALASISVTPQAPQVAAGGTTQLTATGTYTDNSTQNITPTATWASSAPNVASVAAGLVSCSTTAAVAGSATISASGATATGTTSGSTTVYCLAPVLQSITIAPTQLTLPTGGTAQLAATGNYSSGPTQTLTNTVQWSSSVSSVATVSATGLVTCNAGATMNGSATITAASGSVNASIGVTCQAPQLKYIKVSPENNCEIPARGQFQLTAIGVFASGATKNVTTTANWTSSAPSIATVSAGLVSCQAFHSYYDGFATIFATVGSVSGWTEVVCKGSGR